MPCLRHTSAVLIPPSCSRSTAMICSSLNLVFFTSISSRRRTLAQTGSVPGEHVKVLKFRSMRAESSDATGTRSASRDDDRITRVGRIIRKTSIDELPQLFNVLLGDMSLVGPRPHALGSLAGDQLFWQVDETYWLRHQLKPGITGLAQVRGHRGATLERVDLVARLQSDMEYIHRWDIWRDIVILANTLKVVLHRNAF
ncbi:sugar transferase [Sphingomonas guangdongensis]|uniref:sugar transferase n=1 Tax=Sphingomonas guangdongensis TaxID=1141890 RepID=UPI000BE3F727